MVNYSRAVDREGFITATRRRTRIPENVSHSTGGYKDFGSGRSKMQSREGKSIKVERKIIGGSMGKKGLRDIIHLAIWSGIKRRFCWLSFKAGTWLSRLLKKEANGGDGKCLNWNYREGDDWMLATRKENENGEFICLQVSHNKEYPSTLYFPAGINGAGWWDSGVFLEDLMFGTSNTKAEKENEVSWVKPAINAWSSVINQKEQLPLVKQQLSTSINSIPNHDLNSLWERTMVVEIASEDFDWKEVGNWMMDKFGWSYGFDLQPIDDVKAVVTKIKNWKHGDTEIHIYPWYSGINAVHRPNPKEISKVWIGVCGIPFNLWEYSTFKAIGDKFGGLAEVCPETSMATDLSEIRMKVNGPVSNGVWCEDLFLAHNKIWVEIRMIGEVLETSKAEFKPIFVSKDRIYQKNKFWHRRRIQITGPGEEDKLVRGELILVGSDERSLDNRPDKYGKETGGEAETTSILMTPGLVNDVQPVLVRDDFN
ncbi:hypothetical protein MKX03_011774 [Papaver bracteatum]|nr:hypothetical protein MKX03_011774 [Papaver bracteatum]